MKLLLTIIALILSFTYQPFASDRTALARITVYWPGEGSGSPSLGMVHGYARTIVQ
jgi:hypothetical protein